MKHKSYIRYQISFILLFVLLAVLFFWNINSGSIQLSAKEVWDIIVHRTGEDTAYNIIWASAHSGGGYSGRRPLRVRFSSADLFQ